MMMGLVLRDQTMEYRLRVLEKKIDSLENTISYDEKMILDLSDMIYKNSIKIDNLEKSIGTIIKKLREDNQKFAVSLNSEERPPHY